MEDYLLPPQVRLNQLLTMEGTIQFVAERTELHRDQVAYVMKVGMPWPAWLLYDLFLEKKVITEDQFYHLREVGQCSLDWVEGGTGDVLSDFIDHIATVTDITGESDHIVRIIGEAVHVYLERIFALAQQIAPAQRGPLG